MWYARHDNTLTLSIYVQPGAKISEIAGFYDGLLKIKLNAPPIEGRANEVLQKYLAHLFEVPLKQVKLVKGEKSRRKVIKVTDSLINPEQLLL